MARVKCFHNVHYEIKTLSKYECDRFCRSRDIDCFMWPSINEHTKVCGYFINRVPGDDLVIFSIIIYNVIDIHLYTLSRLEPFFLLKHVQKYTA